MGILKQVKDKKLSPAEAFTRLYGRPPKKARFLFLRIRIRDAKLVFFFVNLIFLLPFPLILLRPFAGPIMEKNGLDPALYKMFIATGKGTKIRVDSKDVKVFLKIL